MSLEQYLKNRRTYEASLWIFFVVLSMVTNSIVVTLDLQRLQEAVRSTGADVGPSNFAFGRRQGLAVPLLRGRTTSRSQ